MITGVQVWTFFNLQMLHNRVIRLSAVVIVWLLEIRPILEEYDR
jgi:hypothetical protein